MRNLDGIKSSEGKMESSQMNSKQKNKNKNNK